MDVETLITKIKSLSNFQWDSDINLFIDKVNANFDKTSWMIIPFRSRYQDSTIWYACSDNAHDFKHLRTALNAFIGSSYAICTTVSGPVKGPAHEVLIRSFSNAGFYRLTGGNYLTIQENILKMITCYAEAPKRQFILRRPINIILRDFEFALLHDDQVGAANALTAAEQARVLSTQNIFCLMYIKFGHFGHWKMLIDNPGFKDMTRVARPLRVTQAMLDALYAVHIEPIERTSSIDQIQNVFLKLLDDLGSTNTLFQGLKGLKGTRVAKLFLLYDATSTPVYQGRDVQIRALLEREDEKTELTEALLAKISHPDQGQVEPLDMNTMSLESLMSRVREAYQNRHNDEVLELLNGYKEAHAECSSTLINAYFLLAKEFDSLEVLQVALNLLRKLADPMEQEILKQTPFKELFEKATAFYPQSLYLIDQENDNFEIQDDSKSFHSATHTIPPLISNWMDWIESISDNNTPKDIWQNTIKLTAKGAEEWAKPTKEQSIEISQRLHDLDDDRRLALQNYLPQMISCLAQPHEKQEELLLLHTWFIEQLLFEQNITSQTLRATFHIVEMMIAANIQRDKLDQYLLDIVDLWADQASVDLLDWSIDMFELMITSQRPSSALQVRWGSELEATLRRWIKRCSREQIDLYNQLRDESRLQIQSIEWPSDLTSSETPLLHYLDHKYIAIYTLNGSAGSRIKSRLLVDAPKAKIEVFSERGGTKSMNEAAKNAELFVIVTSCATHAATMSIEVNRPKSYSTLHLHSSGSSSLLRVLLDYCKQLSQ